MWTLRTLAPAEWPALAGFVCQHNRGTGARPRCLHADQGPTEREHVQEFAALPPDEACFVVVEAGGETLGWIGAEFDSASARAWARGPLVAPPHEGPQADALRRELIVALQHALPATLARIDAFVEAGEAALLASYLQAGFADAARHHVMRFESGHDWRAPPPDARVRPFEAPDARAVLALHAQVFPESYLPGDTMLDSLDADHRLLVAHTRPHGSAPAGYLYVQHKPLEGEAYIDYLAVAEPARGTGLGRALLASATAWAHEVHGLRTTSLTVRSDRAPALGLYRGAGFAEVAAGAQLTWRRGDA